MFFVHSDPNRISVLTAKRSHSRMLFGVHRILSIPAENSIFRDDESDPREHRVPKGESCVFLGVLQ